MSLPVLPVPGARWTEHPNGTAAIRYGNYYFYVAHDELGRRYVGDPTDWAIDALRKANP